MSVQREDLKLRESVNTPPSLTTSRGRYTEFFLVEYDLQRNPTTEIEEDS